MSEQRKPVLTGGCQCGAVRYALYAMPERAGICHCRMCQKAVGGPFRPGRTFRRRTSPGRAARQARSAAPRPRSAISARDAARRSTSHYVSRPGVDQRGDRQPGHARGGDAHAGGRIESRWTNFDPAAWRRCPRTGPARRGAPEDLARIAIYQHPDHDTPMDWRPPGHPAQRAAVLARLALQLLSCAASSAASCSGLSAGRVRSSASSASIIAATTISRVNHLLSAGTTNHGACGAAVAAIASS